MRIIIVIVALTISSFGQTQSLLNEEYFSEAIAGNFTRIFDAVEVEDGIIIAGRVEGEQGQLKGAVVRLNEIGEVVWSTMSNSLQINCTFTQHIELFDDGNIYGFGCDNIWKINATTGQSEWATPVNYYIYTSNISMVDYDSTRFLVRYRTSQYNEKVAFMDKSTGNTLGSWDMEAGSSLYQNLAVDPYGNILYASGGKLHKFNGDDLDVRIWKRAYHSASNNPLVIITELYCDPHGDIYVFAYDSHNTPNHLLAKINPVDGSVIWKTQVIGNKSLQDYKDKFGYIYMTFEHNYVGGTSSSFNAAKVNKDTGILEYYNWDDMSPVTTGYCISQEAPNVMGIDCDGDIYLSGYYADTGYGPGTWGIMKKNGQNGDKEYDLTITQDTLFCDNESEGKGVAMINDLPLFVGNEETVPWETKATFVALDTATGLPNIRHFIGSDYQHYSSTVDIQNSNDSMFLLIQQGEEAKLRMSTTFGVTDWEFTDSIWGKTKAGCISISSNSAFLATTRLESNNVPTNSFDSTHAIVFFELNKSTGDVIREDSLLISGNIQLIEMESDTLGAAYLLYSDGTNVNILRWDGSGLSTSNILSPVTDNVLSKRRLNIINNYSTNEILFSGEQALYSVDKSTLVASLIYTYPSSRNVYDLMHKNGSIVLSGDNVSGIQSIISIDTIGFSLNWDQTFQPGVIAGAVYDQDTIYTYGETNGQIEVKSIDVSNGNAHWMYLRPNLSATSAIAHDLSFSLSNQRFVVNGAEIHSDGSSDIIIDGVDRSGNGSSLLFAPDELDYKSYTFCSASQFDSLCWVGGSLNRYGFGKEGVNYLIEFFQCPLISSTDVVSVCDSYTWIDGIVYTSSNNSATYTLTNASGCDSVVTLDLTINNVSDLTTTTSGVEISSNNASATYQWLDCDDNNTILSGETGQTFSATANGNYAVELTENGCVDTSDCVSITTVGIVENDFGSKLVVYPNPTEGNFTVDLGANYNSVEINITNLNGKLIKAKEFSDTQLLNLTFDEPTGVYLIRIESDKNTAVIRLVKE